MVDTLVRLACFVKKGGKANSVPYSGARCFTRVGSGLTHKNQTRLERLARDKHSSLLRKSVNCGRNKFYEAPVRSNIRLVLLHLVELIRQQIKLLAGKVFKRFVPERLVVVGPELDVVKLAAVSESVVQRQIWENVIQLYYRQLRIKITILWYHRCLISTSV